MSLALPEKFDLLGRIVPERTIAHDMPWLTAALVPPGCEGPRRRLRAWAEAGCPAPAAEAIAYAGDPPLEAVIRHALAALPPPVRWWASDCVLIVAIGREAAGMCCLAAPPPCARDAFRLIAVSGRHADDEVAAIVAHELGHGWTSSTLTRADVDELLQATTPARLAAWSADFCQAPPDEAAHAIDELARLRFVGEHRAITFARTYGFRGFAADVENARRAADIHRRELRALRSVTAQESSR